MEGILDYALASDTGVDKLNAKLMAKYKEDLNSFLVNSAQEKEDAREDSEDEIQDDDEDSVTPELEHTAALSRPVMKRGDRRPSHQVVAKFNVYATEAEQMDFVPSDVVAEEQSEPATLLVSPKQRFGGMGFDHTLLEEMHGHKLRASSDADNNLAGEGGVCSKFHLDLDSPEFAMCKCGHYRDDHVKRKSTVGGVSKELKGLLKSRRQENPPSAVVVVEVPIPASPSPVLSPPVTPTPVVKPSIPKPAHQQFVPKPMGNTYLPTKPAAVEVVKPPPPVIASKPPPSVIASKPPPPVVTSKPPPPPKPATPMGKVKANEACFKSTFFLDVSASEYGVCAKCGWKKNDHVRLAPDATTAHAPVVKRPVSIKINAPPQPCGEL
ncbi:hypothetical protein BASA81_007908 [Batrachochytrium salamandrivorans]|nr:hypothetical protein BASA81_007908 [Batrachochytrium salamandrivorans]